MLNSGGKAAIFSDIERRSARSTTSEMSGKLPDTTGWQPVLPSRKERKTNHPPADNPAGDRCLPKTSWVKPTQPAFLQRSDYKVVAPTGVVTFGIVPWIGAAGAFAVVL